MLYIFMVLVIHGGDGGGSAWTVIVDRPSSVYLGANYAPTWSLLPGSWSQGRGCWLWVLYEALISSFFLSTKVSKIIDISKSNLLSHSVLRAFYVLLFNI